MIVQIDKDDIPYSFDIRLIDRVFTFTVFYNSEHDFFTVDLERDGEVLCVGEKLVYGRPLFDSFTTEDFPQVELVPKDEAGNESRVTLGNLGETVFLYVGDPL